MKRRTLLAALGTAGVLGLTGCLGRGESSSTSPTTTVAPTSTSPTAATTTAEGEIQRRISLVNQDSVPESISTYASRAGRDTKQTPSEATFFHPCFAGVESEPTAGTDAP